MNKHILVAMSAFCLTGCFGVSVEQCNEYAAQLQNSNDAVQVLKAYEASRDSKSIENTCWAKSLRRQDVNYACLNKENKTDECVLYRRNHSIESNVGFFDFERFLPSDSKIHTEADFTKVLHYYRTQIKACDKLVEKTTKEKQECKDKVSDNVRAFSQYGIRPCQKVYDKEYTELLKEKGKWYEWAINHDPEEDYKYYISRLGVVTREQRAIMYQPVYSKSEASAKIKKDLENWGDEHLCNTANYVNDLSRLGFYAE